MEDVDRGELVTWKLRFLLGQALFHKFSQKRVAIDIGYIYISGKVNYFFFVFLPYNQKQRWEERMNLRKKTL